MIFLSFFTLLFKLVYKDSNLELQSQNLSCYHYTIDHCFIAGQRYDFFLKCAIKKATFYSCFFQITLNYNNMINPIQKNRIEKVGLQGLEP